MQYGSQRKRMVHEVHGTQYSSKASAMYIPCCVIFSKLLWRKLLAKGRIPESEIFLPLVQSQGSDLGQDLGMNFLWVTHVCGHSKPLWMQNLCLICWASPFVISFFFSSFFHLSSTFSCLAILSLDISLPPFLWSTLLSLYLPLTYIFFF